MTAPAPAGPAPLRTILFVEDEEVLRDAISRLLRKQNATVIEVADGIAAVEKFREGAEDIDVVILDLTLPGIPGQQVLEDIRKIRPDVRVILTSAYAREAVMLGVPDRCDFIRKPYRFEELLKLLRQDR